MAEGVYTSLKEKDTGIEGPLDPAIWQKRTGLWPGQATATLQGVLGWGVQTQTSELQMFKVMVDEGQPQSPMRYVTKLQKNLKAPPQPKQQEPQQQHKQTNNTGKNEKLKEI